MAGTLVALLLAGGIRPAAAAPGNDNFVDAEVISGASGSVTGSNEGAAKELGEPDHAGDAGGASIWYSWVAPASGRFFFNTCDSNFDTLLAVYTGTSVDGLTPVESNDDSCGTRSRVAFAGTAGFTYQIAIDGYFGAVGDTVLSWEKAPNDFVDAQVISGASGSVISSNEGADKEAGEPDHAGNAGGASIWYSWVAPASGRYLFNTCSSDFDTLLAVYTGVSVNALSPVAASDNACGAQSRVGFVATSGVPYRIAIDGRNPGAAAATGQVVLSWNPSPANDDFVDAEVISGATGSVAGTNEGATEEIGEPDPSGNSAGFSIWYAWTAPATAPFTFDTCGSDFDTVLAIYTGTSVDGLTLVESNDDSCGMQSSVDFAATVGVTYRISVDSFSGGDGEGPAGSPGNSVLAWQIAGAATPSVTTQASPAAASVGAALTDTASLVGGLSPTGTMTFRLFGPGDDTCTAAPVFTSTKAVAASAAASDPFTAAAPGSYNWIASYSGDADNAAAAGACNDDNESVTVASVVPTLTTLASPAVVVGGTLTDSATLAGGISPTGTITFRLYGPGDTTCASPPVFISSRAVAGNGPVTSGAFLSTSTGTYRWIASYSGDDSNSSVLGVCGEASETVLVTQASPALATTATPATTTVGSAIHDIATVSGGFNPAGTVTFRLFSDAACTAQIFTSTDALSAGTASSGTFTTVAPITYRWIASYSGDANNLGATGACNDVNESTVVNLATPSITTVASPAVPVGGQVSDTATLTGGINPSGTVTFRLFGPGDVACLGPPVSTSTAAVSVGSATSAGFTTNAVGTHHWIAAYSGDENNAPTAGACDDVNESVVVGQAVPTIATVASASVPVGGTLTDTATLTGAFNPTGTITFRLYGPVDATCAAAPVFTDARPVSAAGTATSQPFTTTTPGIHRWIASYSGDVNNVPVAGACNDANESATVGLVVPTFATLASPGVVAGGTVSDTATLAGGLSPTGSVAFRLYGPDNATCAGAAVFTNSKSVAGNGAVTSDPFTTVSAGTYRWVASYSGDANNSAVSGACNDPGESVVVSPFVPPTTTSTTTSTSTTVPPTTTTSTSTTSTSTSSTSTTSTSTTSTSTSSTSTTSTSTTSTSTTSTSTTSTTAPPTTTSTSTSTTVPPTTTTSTTSTSTTTSTSVPPTSTTSTSTSSTTSTSTTSTTPRPTTTTEPPDDSPQPPVPVETTTTSTTTTLPTITTTTTSQSTTTLPPATTTSSVPPVGTTATSAPAVAATTATTGALTTTSAAPTTTPSAAPTTTPPPPTSAPTTPTSAPPAPPPGPTIDARNPIGDRFGPPGVGLDVSGTGYGNCRFVYVFFDGQRVGTVQPGTGGTVDGEGLSVPGDASVGTHQVTTSCQSSGKAVQAATTFTVTHASMHRSAFATSLAQPRQISLDLDDLATSGIAALLLLLLFAFPYELFNSTVEENYDEIRGWFHLPARATATARSRVRTVGFFVLNLAAAGAYGFLSPDFGLNQNSLVVLLGMFVALVTMSAVFSLPSDLVIHRRFGEWGTLNFLPGSLGISILMVIMSRQLHLQPGYVYGAMAGLAFRSPVGTPMQGRCTAANWTFSLLLAVGAWFARVPVSQAAAQPDASVWWMGVEVCLALIFLWGVESLIVAMLPMRFLDGRKVIDWSRPVWAVLMFLGAFTTVHVLLSANSGYVGHTGAQVRFGVFLLFAVFGTFSVAVWAYFRYRPERWVPHPESETG